MTISRSAILLLLFSLNALLSTQAKKPIANEEGIVPLAYHVVPVTLESSLSPEEAVVRYVIDGKGRELREPRTTFPFIHPLFDNKAEIVSKFGLLDESPTGPGKFHPGIDFMVEKGADVRAGGAGKVIRTGYTAGYGVNIAIDHGMFISVYAHLEPKPLVKRNDRVEPGQIIGKAGDTGHCDHALLHYEIQLSKSRFGRLYAVDPEFFISLNARAGSKGRAATLCYGFIGLKPSFEKEGKDLILRFDVNGSEMKIRSHRSDVPVLHPLGKPKATITTKFGIRKSPFTGREEFHSGIDIVTPYGSPVKSPADGLVVKVGAEGGYGSLVMLRHGDFVTLFSHLDGKNLVKVGDTVKAGQTIGKTGKTGMSTGPHVHYEIRYVPDRADNFHEEVKFLFDPVDIMDVKAQ